MIRISFALLIAALVWAATAKAGSPDFTLSLYACSDTYAGGEKMSDNCLKTDEEKLEDMESMEIDPED